MGSRLKKGCFDGLVTIGTVTTGTPITTPPNAISSMLLEICLSFGALALVSNLREVFIETGSTKNRDRDNTLLRDDVKPAIS